MTGPLDDHSTHISDPTSYPFKNKKWHHFYIHSPDRVKNGKASVVVTPDWLLLYLVIDVSHLSSLMKNVQFCHNLPYFMTNHYDFQFKFLLEKIQVSLMCLKLKSAFVWGRKRNLSCCSLRLLLSIRIFSSLSLNEKPQLWHCAVNESFCVPGKYC